MITVKADNDTKNGVLSLVKDSTFKVYHVSRENASNIITSTRSPYKGDFSGYGVYILIEDKTETVEIKGSSEKFVKPIRFYVGKAGGVSKRFVAHCSKSSVDKLGLDWTDAIIFMGRDPEFPWGEDEIQWFEHWLLKGIIEAGRYAYTNDPAKTKLGKVDEVKCENQLADMKFLISLLGYPKLFDDSRVVKSSTTTTATVATKPAIGKKIPKGKSSPCNAPMVVQLLMKHLFDGKLITDSDIKDFTAPSSHRAYRIGSVREVTMMTDYANHTKKYNDHVRYYSDKYTFKGNDYALTNVLRPKCIPCFLDMAKRHGLSENDVANLCPNPKDALKFFADVKARKLWN